jgi:hypothetical protein
MKFGPVRKHEGVCDASAAVFVQRDDTRFLVADDEDQEQTFLRLYDSGADGPPIEEFHLNHAFLKPDPEEPEIDIEASAWLGGRIFWIGSHSRSKKGSKRRSRQCLFATTLKGAEPVASGSPYCTLIADVKKQLNLDLDPKQAPKDGGLSIEGLASTPDGDLLIGLRSPLIGGRALLLPLLNSEAIVDKQATAKFGDPIYLELDGLGVRSIDYWHARRSYLMIAGPIGGGVCSDCRILRWSGRIASRPEVLDKLDFRSLKLGADVAPEALLVHESSEAVYVLFDEGNRAVRGTKCKDSKKQSFSSVSILGI